MCNFVKKASCGQQLLHEGPCQVGWVRNGEENGESQLGWQGLQSAGGQKGIDKREGGGGKSRSNPVVISTSRLPSDQILLT